MMYICPYALVLISFHTEGKGAGQSVTLNISSALSCSHMCHWTIKFPYQMDDVRQISGKYILRCVRKD